MSSRKIISITFAIIYYTFLLVALIIFGSSSAYAQTATVDLAWDCNTEPDLKDYTIYKSETSGDYASAIAYKVSLNPAARDALCPDPYDPFKVECCEYTISDLVEGTTYYFVATASDVDDNESAHSTELSHAVPIITIPKKSIETRKIIDMKKIEK